MIDRYDRAAGDARSSAFPRKKQPTRTRQATATPSRGYRPQAQILYLPISMGHLPRPVFLLSI
jgi:hypothetical protein